MKISIITVVFNGQAFLANCIQSVISQQYEDIEYIIVDGGSTDDTPKIIETFREHIHQFVSERDHGMYDALNKGIKLATGHVIGILNADDELASADVIGSIADCFLKKNPDAVYGNLNYVDPYDNDKIIRRWIGKPFTKTDIVMGWMPAHPTFYAKRRLFDEFGNYSLNYGSAADYELMVRFLYRFKVKAIFLNKLIVNMRIGGMSNATLKHRYSGLVNDYKALRANRIPIAFLTVFLKKISKLVQFVS